MPYTIQQIKTKITPILRTYGIKKAYLFGSYANGHQTDKSDLDIMVDSSGQLKGLAFVGLLENLVNILEIDVDLLDIRHIIPNSEIYNQIMNTGIIIYDKQRSN